MLTCELDMRSLTSSTGSRLQGAQWSEVMEGLLVEVEGEGWTSVSEVKLELEID